MAVFRPPRLGAAAVTALRAMAAAGAPDGDYRLGPGVLYPLSVGLSQSQSSTQAAQAVPTEKRHQLGEALALA